MSAPVCVDLFCGCGGLSTGLLDAASTCASASTTTRRASPRSTSTTPRGARTSLQADVRELTGARLAELAGAPIQLLVGGPPCQPFSVAGKRRALADHRGDLIFEFVRLLAETQADAFIFENVPNLASVAKGEVLADLLAAFAEVGYTRHGTRSARGGLRRGADAQAAVHRRHARPGRDSDAADANARAGGQRVGFPYVTARDVLDDLPDVRTAEAEAHRQPRADVPLRRDACRVRQQAPGTREPKSRHDRLHPERPSYTLRAGTGNFSPLRPVHYQYDRVLDRARVRARAVVLG